MSEKNVYELAHSTAEFLFTKTHHKPEIGIVCGSGLGTLVEILNEAVKIPYETIPNFPKSTVAGHAGNLVFGILGGKTVVCMQGRFHPYEGYNTDTCTFAIRAMKALGVQILIATNASGGLNPKYNVGDIVVVKDHINFPGMTGQSPLHGPNDERFGPRFLALSDAYDRDLQKLALSIGEEMNLGDSLHNGVYFMQWGPCYETIAECRMVVALGGDVVGMSTTHEVIVARHMGLKVLTLSLVTNKAILDYNSTAKANHEEVMETSRQRAEVLKKFVEKIVTKIPSNNE